MQGEVALGTGPANNMGHTRVNKERILSAPPDILCDSRGMSYSYISGDPAAPFSSPTVVLQALSRTQLVLITRQ